MNGIYINGGEWMQNDKRLGINKNSLRRNEHKKNISII